jgi:hypothetical protein
MNLAIKTDAFDHKGQIMSSQVVEITGKREFGFYEFNYRRHAKWSEPDGSFVWLPVNEPHEWVIFGLTAQEEAFAKQRGDTIRGDEFFDFLELPHGMPA